jgi:ABC-2 type transport system permease protein
MKNLIKLRIRQFLNRAKQLGFRQYLLFSLFGFGILFLMSLFFIKVFGFIYLEEEFPLFFKLFISEKILLMVFLSLFSMLVLSALISTLNILFLSKDLRLLFSSPLKTGTVFFWKSIEVGINSGLMVLLFSLPALFSYCYYFAPKFIDIAAVLFFFFLYTISGVIIGILIGLIIPAFFSVKKLQPVLALVAILLISSIVIFLRLLKPEQFGNPAVIDNMVSYMANFDVGFFSYFPFAWLSKAFTLIAKDNYVGLIEIAGAFFLTITLLVALIWFLQKKFYFKLFDKINKSGRSKLRSGWKKNLIKGDYGTLLKKEVKTFIRTPAQWSQLLILAAIIVVFILNMKGIPMPHPSFKNLISYLNLGMAAFIVAGLNSRFSFTTIPMENPGLTHLFASPYDRKKIYKFKLLFFIIPQVIIGFILFFTADISLHLDAFARISGTVFLLPLLPFLTVLAIYFSLRIKERTPLTPQHLIVTRSGILYMLLALTAIVSSMIYFIRPLFVYYYNSYRNVPVPIGEITLWFAGYWLIFLIITLILYKRSLSLWQKREIL